MFLFGPPNIEKLTAKRDIDGLTRAMRHKDRSLRAKAAHALMALLNDGESSVRNSAQEALETLGKAATDYVIPAFLKTKGELNENARQLLFKIGDARAMDWFVAMASHPDMEIRKQAITKLGDLKDPGSVDTIIPFLKKDETKIPAIKALGRIGDVSAIHHLIRALEDTSFSSSSVRKEAAHALGKIRDRRAVIDALRKVVDSGKGVVRCREARSVLNRLSHSSVHSHDPATIQRQLEPGDSFEAQGSFGNIIKGTVLRIIDARTIEARCRSHDDQPWETGRFPIERIYKITRNG